MSRADPSAGGGLGPRRLSVRESGDGTQNRSTWWSEEGGDWALRQIPFDKEAHYRSVEEGTSLKIETVGDAIDAFDQYVEDKEGSTLVFGDRGERDRAIVLPYNHRWTPAYRKKVYAALKDGERALERKYGSESISTTLLTLTAHQRDENGDPRPFAQVLRELKDGWKNFRKVMDRATGRFDTEYMTVIEPHKSGYAHLHVIVFGVAKPSLREKVKEMWVEKYGIGGDKAHDDAVSVAKDRSAQVESPAQYAMNYLSQTFCRKDGDQQTVEAYRAFAATLWVTEKRQFSTSEWLSERMKRESKSGGGDWVFIGVGGDFEEGVYEGEVAEELIRHVDEGRGWEPPPSEAVRGFGEQVSLGE